MYLFGAHQSLVLNIASHGSSCLYSHLLLSSELFQLLILCTKELSLECEKLIDFIHFQHCKKFWSGSIAFVPNIFFHPFYIFFCHIMIDVVVFLHDSLSLLFLFLIAFWMRASTQVLFPRKNTNLVIQ